MVVWFGSKVVCPTGAMIDCNMVLSSGSTGCALIIFARAGSISALSNSSIGEGGNSGYLSVLNAVDLSPQCSRVVLFTSINLATDVC